MTNVIIILYMGSSISTYLYHRLITGNYGIIKKRTLKLYKELFLPLTGIWLSKIKINRFLSNKKLPIISPILVDDRVVSNFAEKTELFNSCFASQCTPVTNKSQLTSLEFKTSKRIEKINFTDDDIYLIIKNLNVDKAYGWDNISIRMIKLCGKPIARPLSLIFQSILNDGVFPDDWKKVILSHAIKRTVKT